MKVLHVIEPLATGINTFVRELCTHIEGEHVIVHGIRNGSRSIEEIKSEYPKKITFIRWKFAQREIKFFLDIFALFSLIKVIVKVKPDVIHLHSSKAGTLGRLAALLLWKKKVVYTPNAASFLRTDIGYKKKWFFSIIERFLYKYTPGKIVSTAESEKAAFYNLNIPSKVINNGVTVPMAQVKAQFNDLSSPLKIVTCGVATVQKNPELFNRIAEEMKEYSNIEFIWIGDGELRDTLTSENITVTGWKNKEEVYEILNSSDIYLSTSKWEGLPLSVIEALACGLPLVLRDCAGNSDMVFQNYNGYTFLKLYEAINCIKSMGQSKEQMRNLSLQARQSYEDHFTGKSCANQYEKLYQSL